MDNSHAAHRMTVDNPGTDTAHPQTEHQEVAMPLVHHVIGTLVALTAPPRARDERGLSQSTENAILLAGAAAVALVIITVITAYVTDRLPG